MPKHTPAKRKANRLAAAKKKAAEKKATRLAMVGGNAPKPRKKRTRKT